MEAILSRAKQMSLPLTSAPVACPQQLWKIIPPSQLTLQLPPRSWRDILGAATRGHAGSPTDAAGKVRASLSSRVSQAPSRPAVAVPGCDAWGRGRNLALLSPPGCRELEPFRCMCLQISSHLGRFCVLHGLRAIRFHLPQLEKNLHTTD